MEVLNTNPEQVLFRDDLLFSIVIDVKENHKGAKVALKILPLQKRYEIASVELLCYQTLICFFHVCHQSICMERSIVTMIAFVWLFSTVCFQVCFQIVRLGRCIFTLVTFV